MMLRYVPLLCLFLTASAAAQPIPDTLRAPADSITVFGWTVDADADRVLVGAHEVRAQSVQRGNPKGTVFVFRQRADGVWETEGRLVSDRIGHQDCFSWSMDLRGDLAAVGAECEGGENPDGTSRLGAVYLFRYDGAEWVREAKIYPSDVPEPWPPQYYFGMSVSLGEDYLVVGAGARNPDNPDEDSGSGAAFIFESEGGMWSHTATLVNDDADEQLNEEFGGAVGAVGSTVIVGAAKEDGGTLLNRGAVYIFERSGETWSQRVKLPASAPEASEGFGALIAAGDDQVAIGSFTGVYPLYRDGDAWSVGSRLGTNGKPVALARYGEHILSAAWGTSEESWGYLFTESGGGWDDVPFSAPPFEATRDELVSLTSQHGFVGVPELDSGQVLVYDLGQFVDGEVDATPPPPLALSVAPNPLSDAAMVRFDLPRAGTVRLTVYDVLGREVARLVEHPLAAGPQAVRLETHDLAAGPYLVRLTTDGQAFTRLVTVLR